MAYTISQVARRFGLSRSTLLYYDAIGLLSPQKRSGANYRLYSDEDLRTMEEISRLHRAGVALKEIISIVHTRASRRGATLKRRLADIANEIQRLKDQQAFILELLGNRRINSGRTLNREQWIACLEKAGLDESGRKRWHAEFERSSPEAHQAFLESLGIGADEIRAIRRLSRAVE